MSRLIKYYSHWYHSGLFEEIMYGYVRNDPREENWLSFSGSI